MKKVVNDLLQKEMDRKEFLKFTGTAVLLLSGVTGVFKSLGSLRTGEGYGGSYYGKHEDTPSSSKLRTKSKG